MTLLLKCEGLEDAERKARPVATSKLSLHGLVRHMAEVERGWFRRVLESDPELPYIYFDGIDEDLAGWIRKQALFWAGQNGSVDLAKLGALYDKAPEEEFKNQVIFVLSQRGKSPEAVDKLIDIARNEKNRELRKQAIFWLGQSHDPRALKALGELINR